MMSVHAAKGLEFPLVFLISVASRRFPHSEQSPVIAFPDDLRKGPVPPSDIHLQEERRLFYVALTRARERLYVSSVRSGKKVSQFIDDLLSDSIVAAKDIERIEVPKSEREPGGPRAPETDTGQDAGSESRTWLAKLSRPAETTGQYNLFASGTGFVHGGAYVRPDLDLWVRQIPAGGLIGPDGKMRLSATAIETYRDCPLKFKFIYHRKIPTGPQAALTFGSLMHQSIRYYFELRRKTVPRYEEVRDYYLRSWNGLGFEDSYQEESYKRAGLEQLREFMERQSTIALDPESVSSEQHFSLDLGEIILEGRIDQINQINQTNPINQVNRRSGAVEGSEALSLVTATGVEHARRNAEPAARVGGRSQTRKLLGSQLNLEDDDNSPTNAGYADTTREVELIDYKTGRPRSQKDADKSLQLSVYALAASRELQIKPMRLTFYNLTNNQPVSTVRLPKDLDKAVEIIHDVGSKIRSLQFDPRPGFNCKYCEFVPICPAHEQGE